MNEMKTNISLELLLLNDLHYSKVIGDDVYNLAVQKLYEAEPDFLASAAIIKEHA